MKKYQDRNAIKIFISIVTFITLITLNIFFEFKFDFLSWIIITSAMISTGCLSVFLINKISNIYNIDKIINNIGLPCLRDNFRVKPCEIASNILAKYQIIREKELEDVERNSSLKEVLFISPNLEYESQHDAFSKIMKQNLDNGIIYRCFTIYNDITLSRKSRMINDIYKSGNLKFYNVSKDFIFMFCLYAIAIYYKKDGTLTGYMCIGEDDPNKITIYKKLNQKECETIYGILINIIESDKKRSEEYIKQIVKKHITKNKECPYKSSALFCYYKK